VTQDNRIRIGDLIEVPDVQTVIEIAEARDLDPLDPSGRATLERLSKSFIVTDDIKNILTVIFSALSQQEGRGFFVTGNYGSGKSHLLSVLALAVKHDWAWKSIALQDSDFCQYESGLAGKRFLPVLIPLTDFGSDLSLEEIVWGSIEVTAAAAGIPLHLSHTQRFLDLFERYILPVHSAEFGSFITNRLGSEYSWERIRRDDPASGHTLIIQYMESRDEPLPFKFVPDRRTAIADLSRILQNSNWDGLVLIIDELSEFLKSKSDIQSLNEDTRFLQSLGESSKHYPVWIIAALQEALERTGEIPEAVFKKIKARYSYRLRLSAKHLKELVSRRLIQRKGDSALREIRTIFTNLQLAFNRITIQPAEFIEIYPIHPETLELLDKNSDLFSQQRGIVDFLTAQIRGRPEENIPGILDSPVDHLITPDVIFDHFKDRLAESPQFSKYYRLYSEHFEPRILAEFNNPKDQHSALQLVKILILLSVSPLRETRTSQELADMILYRTLDPALPAGDINYDHIHRKLLMEIYRKIGFLRLEPGKEEFDAVFSIDIESQPSDTLDQRLTRIKQHLSPFSEDIVRVGYAAMAHGKFPLAMFVDRPGIRDTVKWENTTRKVGIFLTQINHLSQDAIENFRKQLKCGELDFVLIIGWIGERDQQRAAAQAFLARENIELAGGWGFCLPNLPENPKSFDVLADLHACRELAGDLVTDHSSDTTQQLIMLNERIQADLDETRRLLAQCYQDGELLVSSGKTDLSGRIQFDHFDQWVSSILKKPLASRFPDHSEVAPHMEISGRIIMELLLEKFILPGQTVNMKTSRNDLLESAIQQIAVPLGIAVKDNQNFRLSASPRKCRAAGAVMSRIPASNNVNLPFANSPVNLVSLYRDLATSKLGMSKQVFDLTVLALIRKGYITGLKNDRIVPIDTCTFPLESSVDHLTQGPLLPVALRPAFARMYRILTKRRLKEFDLDVQELVWIKLKAASEKWLEDLAQFQSVCDDFDRQFPEDCGDLKEIHSLQKTLTSLIQAVNHKADPCTGWEQFLLKYLDVPDPVGLFKGLASLVQFVQIGKHPYLKARDYLNDPRLHIPNTPGYDHVKFAFSEAAHHQLLSSDLITAGGLQTFLSAFETFQKEYEKQYTREHNARRDQLAGIDLDLLIDSPEFRVLKRLSRISPVSVSVSYQSIRRKYDQAKQIRCMRNPRQELEKSPLCTCGYRLGTHIGEPPDDLKTLALKGIQQYLDGFQNDSMRARLRIIHDNAPEKLRDSIHTLISPNLLDSDSSQIVSIVDSLLDDDLTNYLHKELWVGLHIHKRDLSQLVEQLKDQRWTVNEIKKIIEIWLIQDENLDDSDIVNIT
jgi:energy-coupling factor transporter ATP-binding protein EcfA2